MLYVRNGTNEKHNKNDKKRIPNYSSWLIKVMKQCLKSELSHLVLSHHNMSSLKSLPFRLLSNCEILEMEIPLSVMKQISINIKFNFYRLYITNGCSEKL